jgi:antitoxin CptB
MSLDNRKAKIKFNCRRGMLELDLMLNRFVSEHLNALDEAQLTAFETLLMLQDPDLHYWLMTDDIMEQKELADIVATIKAHHTR